MDEIVKLNPINKMAVINILKGFFFSFETGSYIAQAGLKLLMELRFTF